MTILSLLLLVFNALLVGVTPCPCPAPFPAEADSLGPVPRSLSSKCVLEGEMIPPPVDEEEEP